MRVLLVEEDIEVGEGLITALEDEKYRTDWVRDASEGRRALDSTVHTVALVDIGVHGGGVDLIRRPLLAGSSVPVLVISACDDLGKRIEALDAGAADFITTPLHVKELIARIHAVVRRKAGYASSQMVSGPVTLDLKSRALSFGGRSSTLAAGEFCMMQRFFEHPGAIVSREELQKRLYGWETEVENNAVDVLIFTLRRKFGTGLIRNVRGLGWALGETEARAA
ncbi:winged helix-turn-helix domain-containing protein [Paraburkholderia fungorum]|uniref:winged helix-turn-helix domain-containing protein n=1 Tax=Paraburkholderia fungorum TaxID=134537 RepID=UPI0038BCC69B